MQTDRQPRSRRRRAILRRRRIGAAAAALLAGGAFGLGALLAAGDDGGAVGDGLAAAAELPQLPGGGRELLPEHRLVAFYGAPRDPDLGALGIGSPKRAGARLAKQASAYEDGRPVMPVFELLATVATFDPGEDGLYRLRTPHSVIRRYLRAARRLGALLLLDIQPGAAAFADEIERLRRYLREPDVGLALDPEWHVGPGEVPGQVIGSVDAATVNEISARLAALVERHSLPEKLFVVHQFTADMIARRGRLKPRTGLATVINIDGFGDQANKVAKYRELRPRRSGWLHTGLKLFYDEDVGLMEPRRVLRLRPPPDLIVYE